MSCGGVVMAQNQPVGNSHGKTITDPPEPDTPRVLPPIVEGPSQPGGTFENMIGVNTCPPGYTLGRDKHNGTLMCYKNELIHGLPNVQKLKIGGKS